MFTRTSQCSRRVPVHKLLVGWTTCTTSVTHKMDICADVAAAPAAGSGTTLRRSSYGTVTYGTVRWLMACRIAVMRRQRPQGKVMSRQPRSCRSTSTAQLPPTDWPTTPALESMNSAGFRVIITLCLERLSPLPAGLSVGYKAKS